MKPGDLVRITDWDTNAMKGWNPIGTTCVIVDWLESPDTGPYSVHHLELVSES